MKHFVRICNCPSVFCQRYGFPVDSNIGKILHKTIYELLAANTVTGDGNSANAVQIATWLDNTADGGESIFEVNENTASIMYDLNSKLKKSVNADKDLFEGVGRNFLIQQIRGDLFTEVNQSKGANQ